MVSWSTAQRTVATFLFTIPWDSLTAYSVCQLPLTFYNDVSGWGFCSSIALLVTPSSVWAKNVNCFFLVTKVQPDFPEFLGSRVQLEQRPVPTPPSAWGERDSLSPKGDTPPRSLHCQRKMNPRAKTIKRTESDRKKRQIKQQWKKGSTEFVCVKRVIEKVLGEGIRANGEYIGQLDMHQKERSQMDFWRASESCWLE